jgi:hypothetical protein
MGILYGILVWALLPTGSLIKPRKVWSASLKKRRERLAGLRRLQPLTEFLAFKEHARLDRFNPTMLHEALGRTHCRRRQSRQFVCLQPRMPDHCIGRQYGAYKAHLECLVGSKWFAQQQPLSGALVAEKLRQQKTRGRLGH